MRKNRKRGSEEERKSGRAEENGYGTGQFSS